MNRDIAEKWIAALKSGRYLQGKNALRVRGWEQDRFCCLGVLCEIAIAEGVGGSWEDGVDPGYKVGFCAPGEEVSTGILPEKVRDWAGLGSYNGSYEKDDGLYGFALSMDNDNGVGFTEIAAIIRDRVEEL